MSEQHRLHPITYIKSITNSIIQLWYIWAIALYNLITSIGDSSQDKIFTLDNWWIFVILAFFIFVVFEMIQKWTVRYWIEDEKFIYKWGLFVKNERELSIDRIQSIDITQPLIFRFVNAAQVDIKTPAESVKLEGIKNQNAERIRTYIYDKKKNLEDETIVEQKDDSSSKVNHDKDLPRGEQKELVFKMTPGEMVLLSVSSGGFGIFMAAIFTSLSYFGLDQILIQYLEKGSKIFGMYLYVLLALLFVVIVFLGMVIGGIIMFIKYYGYKMVKHHDDLIVEYGLLEKKTITVNKDRVQNILVKNNLIQRILGIRTLSVGITGNDLGEDLSEGNLLLAPVMKKTKAYDFLNEQFSHYNIETPKPSVPTRSYRRYVQVLVSIFLIIMGVSSYFLFDYKIALYSMLVVGALMILLRITSGIYSAKTSGYKIIGADINILTTHFFVRNHYIIKREKIIETKYKQTIFTKRAGLATIFISTASGLVPTIANVRHLELKDVLKIWNWAERGVKRGEGVYKSN